MAVMLGNTHLNISHLLWNLVKTVDQPTLQPFGKITHSLSKRG